VKNLGFLADENLYLMANSLFSKLVAGAFLPALGSIVNAVAFFSPITAGAIALDLFSRPRAAKSRRHDPAFLASVSWQRDYLYEGTSIRCYAWAGKGRKVLLAHGWESNSSRWAPMVRALQDRGYEVYAVDAPAHGDSGGSIFTVKRYAEVLKEIVDTLRPDMLIGHSAGGMAAVFMLQQAPQLPVARLILLAVPSELELLMDTFRRMTFMGDRVFKGMQRAFHRKYGWRMADFSLSRFIREVRVPGLLLHDRGDSVAPYTGALEMHRNWKDGEIISFEGLGHSLPGDAVISAVMQYLDAGDTTPSVTKTDSE